MEKTQERGKTKIPPHEDIADVREEDGGGVTVDLTDLESDKGGNRERDTRRGGEDREEEQDGALDLHEEETGTEEVRLRRKEERKQRKEARERRERENVARIENVERENAELRSRLDRGAQQDVRERVARIDGDMQTLRVQYEEAKKLKEKAYNENKGAEAVQADEAMTAARERYQSLGFERDSIVREVTQAQTQAQQRPKVSPSLVTNAKAFMAEHDWYDKDGGDRDSAKVLALDRQLAKDGWDPNTNGYWEELRERVKEELPHKFGEGGRQRVADEDDTNERPAPRRQTTGGSGRESAGGGGGNSFYLSAARVAALKEAGMWDDPAKRTKMIKTYKARDEAERKQKARG